MHMDNDEIEDKNNDTESGTEDNLLDIWLFVLLIWFDHAFHSHCLYPLFQICVHCIWFFGLKIYNYRA